MNDSPGHDRSLASALRAVADDDQRLGASPSVEARLVADARAIAGARRRADLLKVYAAAAVVVFAVSVAVWLTREARRDDAVAESTPAAAGGSTLQATEFFPLFYSSVPVNGVQVIRLEVARAALATFGVESFVSPASTAPTVLADVVVGEDGLARAIRFVHPVFSETQEELRP